MGLYFGYACDTCGKACEYLWEGTSSKKATKAWARQDGWTISRDETMTCSECKRKAQNDK